MRDYYFVAEGRMYFSDGNVKKEIPSGIYETYIERLRERAKAREWKNTGEGARFTGAYEPGEDVETRIANVYDEVVQITPHGGKLLFSENVDGVCGIYSKTSLTDRSEGIVLSDANYRYRRFDIRGNDVVLSASFAGESHIALAELGRGGCRILTEGETVDDDPVFDAKGGIYYSSAGLEILDGAPEDDAPVTMASLWQQMGQGRPTRAIGNASLCYLTPSSGTLVYVRSDPNYDFYRPQVAENGDLYYIKKPYTARKRRSGGCLKEIVLAPVRLIGAIFGFFNFFTIKYSGKALHQSGDTKRKSREELFIDGNLIRADKEEKRNRNRGETCPGIIPASFELRKIDASGNDTLVKAGVLSYRLIGETLCYSNGSALIERSPDGRETVIARARGITHIAAEES